MIRLHNLTKAYPSFELAVNIELGREVTAIIGPSGSGKSTLLELIAGFETPDSGTLSLDGRPLAGRAPEQRDIGMVFQTPTLFPHLSVRENIEYGATVTDAAIRDLCELLEIEELLDTARSPETLSGGEQRRVSVARAIATDPDALLLDEPTTGLDEPIRRRLKYELRRVLDDLDIPCVYVTHDQSEASVVADSVAVMRDGTILQQGRYEELLASPRNAFVADFVGIENLMYGEVREADADRVIVDTGVAWVASDQGLPDETLTSDGEVCVGIAPEAISVTPATSGNGGCCPQTSSPQADTTNINRLDCTVQRVISERGSKTVLLECGFAERLKAVVSDDTTITNGSDVTVAFDASDLVVV